MQARTSAPAIDSNGLEPIDERREAVAGENGI
jgi:hypothetical protein